MVEQHLEALEACISDQIEQELDAQWRNFLDGHFEGDVFDPRRSRSCDAPPEWPTVSVNKALDDPDRMVLYQYGDCLRQLREGTGGLLCVRANFGTSILPSLFGVELFYMEEAFNTLPTSHPLGGTEKIRDLVERGVPDLQGGFGSRVFEMGQRYVDIAARYPRIGKHVHIYHPDLQGPLDVCEVLWGCQIMTALYDEPDLLKALLELVTETYLLFMNEWTRLVPFGGGPSAHWSMMHGGNIMLRDDSAMNISPALFDQFVTPYDQRLLSECGGGAVHFCGRGDHFIEQLSCLEGLKAVNMSQPECNDMEVIYRHTLDKGIPLIGLERWAADAAIEGQRPLHGRVHVA